LAACDTNEKAYEASKVTPHSLFLRRMFVAAEVFEHNVLAGGLSMNELVKDFFDAVLSPIHHRDDQNRDYHQHPKLAPVEYRSEVK
jgi:hypothetical protein